MKTVTIMVDYRTIQSMLRAFDTHVSVHPEDSDAVKVRQLIIESGAIMELENLMDALLEEESSMNPDCKACEHKDECHPPNSKVN